MTFIPNTLQRGGRNKLFPPFTDSNGLSLIDPDNIMCKPVTGIEFFEKNANEVVEERQGSRENNFPNTQFAIYRNSRTLLMFFGESWAYGGKLRDMHIGNTTKESSESIKKGVKDTVGPIMSAILNSDLYQSCWPGDHTTNMFNKAEKEIPNWINQYNKIRVCIQITDPHRCANACHVHESEFIKKWTREKREDLGLSVGRWLYEYDRSFLKWADDIKAQYPDNDIEFVIWKNFNPWLVTENERKKYNCKTVPKDWTTFNAELDGVELKEGRQMSNPALLLENNNCVLSWCPNTDKEYKQKQLDCIESIYAYWDDTSWQRLQMNVTYPSAISHRLWAMQLAHAGGWV